MHPEYDPALRDKVTRLMGVLRQLAAAKYSPTRHTDQYRATVWLDRLQQAGTVGAPAGPGDEVARMARVVLEPEPPRPAVLAGWLQPRRDELSEPRLRARGVVDGVEIGIEEAPEIRQRFDHWMLLWHRWSQEERQRRRRKQVYDDLFDVHRLAVEQPESVEIVLAAGLLQVPDSGLRVHLVTQPVTVEQDAESGDMVCVLSEESGIRLEDDEILSGLDGFDLTGSRVLRDRLLERVATPLDPELAEFCKEWADRVLPSAHEISDDWEPATTSGPSVTTAPAVVARRRGAYAIRAYYDEITRSLGDPEQPVPLGLAQLVASIEPEDRVAWLERAGATAPAALTERPLFPLPANEEQAQIFDRLGHDSGVVVEGPPGTGKTHTIANLVSALLAQGQRVLVTSEKAQALRVLRDKLPPGMQELCVSLTDASAKGDSDLNRSVGTLAGRKADFQPDRLRRRIDDLRQRRDAARSRRSTILEDIRALREAETYVHPAVAPGFAGTLSQIADSLNRTAAEDSWLGTGVEGDVPLREEELDELLGLLREETAERVGRRGLRFLDPSSLPSQERFAEAARAVRAGDAVRAGERGGLVGALESLPAPALSRLEPVSNRIIDTAASLRNLPQNRDVAVAVVDGLLGSGSDHMWQRALGELPAIDRAIEHDREAGYTALTTTGPIDAARVADALIAWADAVDAGARSRSVFKSAEQKAAEPFFDVVRVDGRPARAAADARAAGHAIRVGMIAGHLDTVFAPFGFRVRFDVLRSALVEQLLAIRHACAAIESVRGAVGDAAALVAALPPGRRPWLRSLVEAEQLASLARGVSDARRAALARTELDAVAERIRGEAPAAQRPLETDGLLSAIEAADETTFVDSLRALDRAARQQAQQARCDELYARARRASTSLAEELRRDPTDPAWNGRVRRWPQAWARSVAATWFEGRTRPGREQELENDLEVVVADLAGLTADLAADQAWMACLTRMTAAEVQALQAYRNSMANVGKGTGKYAERYRQAAREAMQAAQAAVPAWVMPIQQVLASIPPAADTFDVVIVDEASQAELTSAFLLWLAPRVIVVGDDRQCTPSEVSSGALQPVFDRIDSELHDFPSYLRSSFTPKDSIFSVLRSRFGQVIRLREHFRCMPEIITWCSTMFYRDAPLVPLRQFGADRLPPLRTTYVRGAEVDGRSGTVHNQAEAAAIAESIAGCLEDEQYDGRTFGVVVLQGQTQTEVIRTALMAHPAIAEQWDERRIRVGTPPDFQGDERHVVWLSMVRAPNSPNSTLTKREFEQRFNVAVSRAQDQLWLFHSVTLDLLRPGDLRRELLDYMTATGGRGTVPPVLDDVTRDRRHTDFDSLFEQRVFLDLLARGYHVTPQVESNGRFIDLVVTGAEGKLAVECDGDAFHSSPEQLMNDLHREQELKRCGWTFERIRGSEYTLDPQRALAPVFATLDRLGIGPLGEFTDGTWVPSERGAVETADVVEAATTPGPVATVVEERLRDPGAEPEPTEEPAAGPVVPAAVAVENGSNEDRILDLARSGPFTSNRAADLLGVSVEEARGRLNKLVARGALVKSGQTRGTRYGLPGVDQPDSGQPQRSDVMPDEVDTTDRSVLLDIARRDRLTNAKVREVLGVDAHSANVTLSALVREGALRRLGRARGTYYIAVDGD